MNFNKKIATLILALSLTTSSVLAVEEKMSIEKHAVLNIKDCVGIALQNSPKIKKARYNYGIAKGNVGIAKSGYFPTLGVGTGYNLTENRTNRANTSSNIYSAEASINQLLLIPCVILDFLCIHPFRDGNGRMSRLLTLLLLYKNGFDAGKYISFEEQINNNKAYYYDALEKSSVRVEFK